VSHAIFRKPTFKQLEAAGAVITIDRFDFLGVWDTVDAYGGPIEEITRAIDYWYWPLSMPDQFMTNKIGRACHALALEEERDAFRPVLWDERYVRKGKKLVPVADGWTPPQHAHSGVSHIDNERISQVWFVGVHSDVGGGYSRDGLAHSALAWMIERAKVYGLTFLPLQQDLFRLRSGSLRQAQRFPPRTCRLLPVPAAAAGGDLQPAALQAVAGRGFLAHRRHLEQSQDPEREVKRELADPASYVVRPAPKVHQSVLERVRIGTDGYAPIVLLPESYDVVDAAGAIASNGVTEPAAPSRVIRSEKVWDWVWARRVTYFLTVFASLFLAGLPLIEKWRPGAGRPARPRSSCRHRSGRGVLAELRKALARRVSQCARTVPDRGRAGRRLDVRWRLDAGTHPRPDAPDLANARRPPAEPAGFVYRLRSAGPYRAFFYVLKHWTLPSLFAP